MQTCKVHAVWAHMEYEALYEMPGVGIERATHDAAVTEICPRYYDVVLCKARLRVSPCPRDSAPQGHFRPHVIINIVSPVLYVMSKILCLLTVSKKDLKLWLILFQPGQLLNEPP